MKQLRLSSLVAAAVLAAATVAAPAQDRGVKRLTSGGDDGEQRYYVVRCLDGTVGSVVAAHDSGELCATPQGGEPRCNRKWNLSEAGSHACKAGGAR